MPLHGQAIHLFNQVCEGGAWKQLKFVAESNIWLTFGEHLLNLFLHLNFQSGRFKSRKLCRIQCFIGNIQ